MKRPIWENRGRMVMCPYVTFRPALPRAVGIVFRRRRKVRSNKVFADRIYRVWFAVAK